MQSQQVLFPHWMRGVLLLTAAYNVFWGAFIAWFPETFYQWVTQTELPNPAVIPWQGAAVIAMAVVYTMAAVHPGKYWFLTAFGAFTKLAGGIWFYLAILEQNVGDQGWYHLIMNDAAWIPLLLFIAFRAKKYGEWQKTLPPPPPPSANARG